MYLFSFFVSNYGRLQSLGSLRVRHDCVTSLSLFLSCIGEGHGNPLQCSCLENPRDRGGWWAHPAPICGVAQSRTRLKWLSSSMGNLLIFLEESNFGNLLFLCSVSWIFIIIYYLSYLLWYHIYSFSLLFKQKTLTSLF